MENQSLLHTFAMDKGGRVRSVDEVSRGLACECTCPCCGEPVNSRQGQVRGWHFAHASGADCAGAAESALHRAAKQVLLDSGGMTVPEVRVETLVTLPDGRSGKGEAYRRASWVDFHSAEAERDMGRVRPDLVVATGHTMLLIEIAVTHFADEEKKAALARIGIPTIETDLAHIERERWDWESLREVLVEGTAHKQWIHELDRESLEQEAREMALEFACGCPANLSTSPATPKAPRTRFRVGDRFLDVVERPFGLAIWSPYDPQLNERIKGLMRILGGRWQPRFKSWLLPLEAKAWLFDELDKWANGRRENMF